MFPVFMVPTTNANSVATLDDIPEDLMVEGVPDSLPEDDVELNMVFFTETPSSEDGLYYVCKRGTDSIAYFGASTVKYLSGGTVFTLEFPGSRLVVPQGESPTGSVTNYMLGNDPAQWKTGIEDCAILRYSEIYPGIDLVYKIYNRNLKYEFVVSPYSDPELLRLEYVDVDSIEITDDGLIVTRDGQQMADTQLNVFQKNGAIDVGCRLSLDEHNSIIFDLDMYDISEELIIDPILLVYSSFLGGSYSNFGRGIAVENGFIYITGMTQSSDFPTVNANASTYNGGIYDCFVTKLATDGQSLIFSTYLGGSSYEEGFSIAVENGFAFVTGYTYSTDFPTTENAFDSTINGNWDCFVTKFAANGMSLVYSTFLGGALDDRGHDIVVENGFAYITGYTRSSDFPTENAFDSSHNGGPHDCFVTKFEVDGQSLVYSTYIGGVDHDYGYGIAVENGFAYVIGHTDSSGFPTINAYNSTYSGNQDCFVTKLNTTGNELIYSTFLGGINSEEGYGIDVEGGYAYVTGLTYSPDFPTENAYDSTQRGNQDCFVSKLNTTGKELIFSTYLGGSNNDLSCSIAVEGGYAYITGNTNSAEFPSTNAFDSTQNGGVDCFVTMISTDGHSFVYSTFIGGTAYDYGNGIAVESGYAYITGYTYSTDFPTVHAYDSTFDVVSYDCFVSKLSTADSDMDGLSDWAESIYGTNPYCIDTDTDNFLDGYEIAYGSSATDPFDYPAIPQAWYDEIYEDLDGNATLIQNLITWSDGNANLLEKVMQQLDDNSTLLTQVISWLHGNHSAIETLFTQLDGNATLLLQTVNSMNGNSSLIQNLITWSNGNSTLLESVIQQMESNATLLQQVIGWLDGNHSAIETLFTYVEGNATLLLETINACDSNTAQLLVVAALATSNYEWLQDLNSTAIGNITEIRVVLAQLGVTVGDLDYDGLDDLEELFYGTDLDCIDTDIDNLTDAFEIKLGTDPLNDDSDDDTYLDGFEILSGTDPLDPNDYPGSETPTTTTGTTTTGTPSSTTTPPPETSPLVMILVLSSGAGGAIIVVILVMMRKRRLAS